MLARKAGYIGYEGSRSVAVPAGRERQKFNQLVFKTLFAVFLIAFSLSSTLLCRRREPITAIRSCRKNGRSSNYNGITKYYVSK